MGLFFGLTLGVEIGCCWVNALGIPTDFGVFEIVDDGVNLKR